MKEFSGKELANEIVSKQQGEGFAFAPVGISKAVIPEAEMRAKIKDFIRIAKENNLEILGYSNIGNVYGEGFSMKIDEKKYLLKEEHKVIVMKYGIDSPCHGDHDKIDMIKNTVLEIFNEANFLNAMQILDEEMKEASKTSDLPSLDGKEPRRRENPKMKEEIRVEYVSLDDDELIIKDTEEGYDVEEEDIMDEDEKKEIKSLNKDELLVKKVEALIEALKEEEDPKTIAINIAKLKMLKLKMQKEINIQKIKDEKDEERDEIETIIQEKKKKNRQEKANARHKSYTYGGNSEYDPKSIDFIYKEDLEDVKGDVDELLKVLRKEGLEDEAEKIETINKRNKILEQSEEDYKKAKETSADIRKEEKESMEFLKQEERAMIKQEKRKANIFSRLFQSIKEGIEEYRRTKQLKKEYMEEDRDLQQMQQKYEKNITREDTIPTREEMEEIAYSKEAAKIQGNIDRLTRLRDEELKRMSSEIEKQRDSKKDEFRKNLVNEEAIQETEKILKQFKEMKGITDIPDGDTERKEEEDLDK